MQDKEVSHSDSTHLIEDENGKSDPLQSFRGAEHSDLCPMQSACFMKRTLACMGAAGFEFQLGPATL